MTYGGTFWPNQPHLHQYFLGKRGPGQDMVAINDCYLRAMHHFRYIAVFDFDEVVEIRK